MYYVKIMVFAFLLMMLAISPGIGAQEIAKEYTAIAENTILSVPPADADDSTLVRYLLQLRETQPELFAGAQGVPVLGVEPGSLAEKVGLGRGDVVIAYAGQQINTAEQLVNIVQAHSTEPQVELRFVRSEVVQTVVLQGGQIGIYLTDITEEALHRFALNRLQEDGEKAYHASDYSTALEKWQTGLIQARTSDDKWYISRFLSNIGLVYWNFGQYAQALESYEQALAIARELGDRQGEGEVLSKIGNVYSSLGQHEWALRYYKQALTIAQELGDRYGEGAALTNIGLISLRLGQYEQALMYREQALTIHRKLGNRRGEGADLAGIGQVYRELGQYAQALKYYEQALAITQEIEDRQGEGETLTNIGGVYSGLGQYEQALGYYEQALAIRREIRNRWGEGSTLTGIGVVYDYLGQYARALEYYEQALTIMREIGARRGEGRNLNNIGLVYSELGQYEQGLEYYEQALAIMREIGDRHGEGNILGNIGVVYRNIGQYARALEYYGQALAITREIGDRYGEGNILGNIGAVYTKVREYAQALGYYKQTLAITREIGDRHVEGDTLTGIGVVYQNLKQYEQSLRYYEQALTITQEIGDRRGEGENLGNIGLAYTELGQYEQARQALKASLEICHEVGASECLWRGERGLAKMEAKREKQKEAVMYYEHALNTVETIRVGLSEKEAKTFFMQDKLFVYYELIDLLQNLHKKHPDKGYDRKAFDIFERKQGRVFLEEMGKSGARLFTGIPDDILQRERDLELQCEQTRKHLVDERSKIITEQNKELIQTLEQREKTLLSEQETLQATIKIEYPDYYALRYPQPAALSELQQSVLQPGELMLVYDIMEAQTVLWVVSKQDFSLVTLDIGGEELQKEIETFRESPDAIIRALDSGQKFEPLRVAEDTLDNMAQTGYALYQRLFPEAVHPFIVQAHTLYIIPTGPLYGLPFEALVTKAPEENEGPHYLLQNYSVMYLSSASLLKVLRDAQARRKKTTNYPLLAFANPVYEPTPGPSQADSGLTGKPTPTPSQADSGLTGKPTSTPSQADSGLTGKPTPTPSQEGNVSLQVLRSQEYLTLMGGSKFQELPQTEEEAKTIAAILEAPEESEPLQLRERASRSNLFGLNEQERLDDYRYLLFSAHAILPGEVDHINQPAIVLSHPETGGYLTMADAFGLQLNAGLVVLSACNTGQGEHFWGEGIMGLTRAFMYAGTPAVEVTLWSVEATASKHINTRFFRHLKAGKNLADALRQAKLDLLVEAEEDSDLEHFRHPFFWAPFVVFGDASSK